MKKRILIAEDDENFGDTLCLEYADRGYQAKLVRSLDEFMSLKSKNYERAVIDLKLGRDSGLELLKILKEHSPNARAVILTGYGSFATAVKAIKAGACNYLPKPASLKQIEACFKQVNLDNDYAASDKSETPSLARYEREYIEYVLTTCEGNISQAAKKLGIYRQSLQRKLKKYTPVK